MINFTGLITPTSISFTDLTGKPYTITNAHPNFVKIKDAFKVAKNASQYASGSAPFGHVNDLVNELVALTDVASTINNLGKGKIFVKDGVVWYSDRQIHNTVTTRILEGLNEGFDMNPYILFLENLLQNPSEVAVKELYDFMEFGRMGITDDGYLLGYKKVRTNYTDVHSGRFDNHPGQSHSMPRERVDPNRQQTCSTGFHFCSFDYLSKFGGDRVVLVKVNPRDVVAVPADYNNTKARCCAYTVLSELEDYSSNRLGDRAVWTNTHIHNTDLNWETATVKYPDNSENTYKEVSDFQDINRDWADVEEESGSQENDYDLADYTDFLAGEMNPELVEYFLDKNEKTVKVRVHEVRDEEVYTTEDLDLIAKVFEFIKSRAALTGEKQAVKIVRI